MQRRNRGQAVEPSEPARPGPAEGRGMNVPWKIGCAGFHMKIESYLQRFDAVEVQQTFFDPPALRTLARWRQAAPEGFSFVLKAWQLITHPADSPGYPKIQRPWAREKAARYGHFQDGEPVREAWATLRECAEALQAGAILFRTPASFTPSEVNRRNMTRFFSSMERNGRHLVWDPEGVWQDEEVRRICHELGLIPAQDPLLASPEAGEVFYFRMKPKTRGRGAYGPDDFYRILEAVEAGGDAPGRRGYVIWNTGQPDRDAKRFQDWLRRTLAA